jgi:hypothetical protein
MGSICLVLLDVLDTRSVVSECPSQRSGLLKRLYVGRNFFFAEHFGVVAPLGEYEPSEQFLTADHERLG